MEKSLCHEGHRERMLNKLSSNPETLLDHELLEVLLYSFIPRIDTNPIAHRLLNTFGSLYGVFNASVKELSLIEGVGDKTATQIVLFGRLLGEMGKKTFKPKQTNLNSLEKIKAEIKNYFSYFNMEKLIITLLDKNYNKITTLEFSDKDACNVSATLPEISKAFAIHKPKFAVIAHNHPSGVIEPSSADDFTTKKINLLCSIYGVELIDHIIVKEDEVFSYHASRRMEYIKSSANLDKLIDGIKE